MMLYLSSAGSAGAKPTLFVIAYIIVYAHNNNGMECARSLSLTDQARSLLPDRRVSQRVFDPVNNCIGRDIL